MKKQYWFENKERYRAHLARKREQRREQGIRSRIESLSQQISGLLDTWVNQSSWGRDPEFSERLNDLRRERRELKKSLRSVEL